MLDAPPPGEAVAKNDTVLLVNRFGVAPLFKGRNFVYRLAENRYETDHYNEFLVPPGEQFTELGRAWLAATTPAEVTTRPGFLLPTHILQGTLTELAGDYRGEPRAVVAMAVVVVSGEPNRASVLLSRQYRRETAVADRTPEALVQGWNRGVQEILADLADDVGRVLKK